MAQEEKKIDWVTIGLIVGIMMLLPIAMMATGILKKKYFNEKK